MHGLRIAARTRWFGFWAALIGAALGPAAFGANLITGTVNAGGGISSNATYTIKYSLGEIAGAASASAPVLDLQSGFIGQLTGMEVPVADFNVTPTIPIAVSNSVTFTDLSSGTITNRFWNFGDGNILTTLVTTVQHTYDTAGSFTVALTITGPAGYNTMTQSNAVIVWGATATPAIAPPGGQFTNTVPIALSCATPGATIYYTTDGSMPTNSSPTYTGAFTLLNSATVQAVAVAPNSFSSGVATAGFTIIYPLPIAATPTFSPANNQVFTNGVSVTILCATPGATIYYTTNGSTPTTNATIYSSPIALAASATIRVQAFRYGYNPSATATAIYTVSQSGALTIVTADPLPTAPRGLPYNCAFAAVNGTPPYTWSLASGQLPTGLKLGRAGALTGKPTAAGATTFTVRVTDASNLATTKEYHLVVANPATTLRGTYTGLVIETNTPSHASSGFIKIVLAKTGSFAGHLTLGGAKTAFKGRFDLDGNATVTRAGVSLVLTLDLSGASDQITGTVSRGVATSTLFTSTLLADLAGLGQSYTGAYALVLAPTNSADATLPQGYGYATLTVRTTGRATLRGALADGTVLFAKAPVSKDGNWPFYNSLYNKTGSCISWVTITTNPALTGLVDWFGPTKGVYANFTTTLDLSGAPPLPGAALTNAPWVVTLRGGGLTSAITNQVTVDLAGKVTVNPPNSDALTLSFTPKTGRFTGTFKPSTGGKAISFNGLMLQMPMGGGFFLNDGQSGAVLIAPPPE